MSALCLASGGEVVRVATLVFTLAWTHTIERTAWEEDWRVQPAALVLVEARVKGTGAGMEPPADARFDGTWWRWTPGLSLPSVTLRRAPEAGDWRLCTPDGCRPFGGLLPAAADPVTMTPCP